MKLKRIFFPVGQGGFSAEIFSDERDDVCFTVVYDCGSNNKDPRNIQIADFKRLLPDSHKQIDLLFISHFHQDHINGLDELLKDLPVIKTVIPMLTEELILLTRVQNYLKYKKEAENQDRIITALYGIADERDARFGEVVAVKAVDWRVGDDSAMPRNGEMIDSGSKIGVPDIFWEYQPYNSIPLSDQRAIDFAREVKKIKGAITNGQLNTSKLVRGCRDKVQKLYRRIVNTRNDNLYSLVVASTPKDGVDLTPDGNQPRCLYFGDFDFRYNASLWPRIQGLFPSTGTIQIPHHGSKDSFGNALLSSGNKVCVIAVGSDNQFHHPDFWVVKNLQDQKDTVEIVYEDSKSKFEQKFTIQIMPQPSVTIR
ncbi:MAG: MBL fold metallo-hydrolase [Bacteroidales bacterium]|nr:MBL fold metallo-hydrolase [Bacteroidales bacterium]